MRCEPLLHPVSMCEKRWRRVALCTTSSGVEMRHSPSTNGCVGNGKEGTNNWWAEAVVTAGGTHCTHNN